MSTRRRMKSKKNKSRSSRGGGVWDRVKGLFDSGSSPNNGDTWNWKNIFGSSKPADSHTEDTKSLSIGTLKIPEAPPVPPGSVQIPGKPPQPQPEPQQQPKLQSLQSSSPLSGSSMQAAPAAGGRRRRRRRTCKKRK